MNRKLAAQNRATTVITSMVKGANNDWSKVKWLEEAESGR